MLRQTISSWRARFARRFGVPLAFAGLVAGVSPLTATVAAQAGTTQNYIVLYRGSSVPASAASKIARAGGTLVYSYKEIGVAIARSSNLSFASALRGNVEVEGAAATAAFATRLKSDQGADANGRSPGNLPNAPATDEDSLSPLQWDMRQIKTPEAHEITGGSPSVLVGDIDTGLDYTHPDLAPNVDDAASVNCVSGAPVQGKVAANDDNGHGTHTAGTIAAVANGFGIVGVAPNVRIAGIKAGNADGFFFPEAVVCSFVWAGDHHVDVTNNSYFADPFLFNCRNDPVQRAIWKAEQRAIRYAQQKGTLVVAAEGNQSEDLSHPTQDATSPDDTTPVVRPVTNACVVIPVEISGVVGVTADGHNRQLDKNGQPNGYLKSFYSSFGTATTDVVAPGGDSLFGTNAEAPNGRVLSAWPFALQNTCLASRRVFETGHPGVMWCYQQGTSMASPHVAGVAALIISRFGDSSSPQNGTMRPGAVESYLSQTADPQPCPGTLPAGYLAFTGVDDDAVQTCQGGTGHNSWYGNGQVNALRAVTHSTGN
jgi:lantibiotic leader peptide-processing serine protease